MLTQFLQVLESLGRNDIERARRLGISVRSISRYKACELPEPVEKLMRSPELLEALADDARSLAEKSAADQPA